MCADRTCEDCSAVLEPDDYDVCKDHRQGFHGQSQADVDGEEW